jgi:hypothetical protein
MSALPNLPESKSSRIHPLVAAAAVSIILACGSGVAAMTGLLPSSKAVAPATIASGETVTSSVASAPAPVTTAPTRHPAATAALGSATPARHQPSAAHGYVPGEASLLPRADTGAPAPAFDPDAGQVTAVNAVQTEQPTTGLGAIGGAVAGGLAGTQIGNGRGRTAATIIGALGGGVAGNAVEHAVRKTTTYQVQVRMADGSYRSFNYSSSPGVQVGERVRVSGDALMPA